MATKLTVYFPDDVSSDDVIYEFTIEDNIVCELEDEGKERTHEVPCCPFCGSNDNEIAELPCDENGNVFPFTQHKSDSSLWYVICNNCGISVGGYFDRQSLVDAYSHRPE